MPLADAFTAAIRAILALDASWNSASNAYGGVDRSMDPAMYEEGGRQ